VFAEEGKTWSMWFLVTATGIDHLNQTMQSTQHNNLVITNLSHDKTISLMHIIIKGHIIGILNYTHDAFSLETKEWMIIIS